MQWLFVASLFLHHVILHPGSKEMISSPSVRALSSFLAIHKSFAQTQLEPGVGVFIILDQVRLCCQDTSEVVFVCFYPFTLYED